ncbi:flagellar basal body L-ring protein FlgH [Azovibrio restrictus]|uniref:flagellar basal body L-ring protein FlgH n=1 Tax=Azovibrio restrictus TaxID=146938 RepID=UPI0026EED2FA|nr:flagellar basal body L-ring protein FlgH [Azovibrio restrictus]
MKGFAVFLALPILLVGCASTPPTSVHQPMTARPAYQEPAPTGNGSIFQANSARPLFEDRRARYVGDILTVNIKENNRASAESESTATRTSEVSARIDALNVPPFNVNPLNRVAGLNAAAESSNTFSGGGDVGNTNAFNGTITVTVIEVLPNGNLLVSGEKQVSIGHQQEFIRLSGVVNPRDIRSESHSVDSSRIADARIEYKASGYISEAQVMGWLARFFLSALPF